MTIADHHSPELPPFELTFLKLFHEENFGSDCQTCKEITKVMSASVLPPQQFNQPSRKGKKAWRKNVDITVIQEGLENVRNEVIAGYVAGKAS